MLESMQKTQSPLALAPALAAAIKRGEEAKKRFLSKQGGTLTSTEVCSVLACSSLELETMRLNHRVLGLSVNEELVYPACNLLMAKFCQV
jgi:hypothetical protein